MRVTSDRPYITKLRTVFKLSAVFIFIITMLGQRRANAVRPYNIDLVEYYQL